MFDRPKQRCQGARRTARPCQGMLNGLDGAAMLEGQGRDDCRVLSVGFSSRADLRPVYEDLGDPAVVEPADAAGVGLAVAFEPEEPMRSPVV